MPVCRYPMSGIMRTMVSPSISRSNRRTPSVGEGNDLLVKLGFAGLLDAGVQVPDVGHHAHDGLAVNLEEQPENAMGRGVLRTHVQDHRLVVGGIQHRGWSHV